MQGIYIRGRRPTSKAALRRALLAGEPIRIEATSFFGNEYDGPLDAMPDGTSIFFVGPDPYTKRSFYGQISKRNGQVTVK